MYVLGYSGVVSQWLASLKESLYLQIIINKYIIFNILADSKSLSTGSLFSVPEPGGNVRSGRALNFKLLSSCLYATKVTEPLRPDKYDL